MTREGTRLSVATPPNLFSLVTLQVFLKRGQDPIHALGESRWVRGRQHEKPSEAGIQFISIRAREKERLVAGIYTPQ